MPNQSTGPVKANEANVSKRINHPSAINISIAYIKSSFKR